MNDKYNNDKYNVDNFAKSLYLEDPEFTYRPGMSEDERHHWKLSLKKRLYERMDFSKKRYDEPIVNLLLSERRGFYRIEKYELSPEPNLWVTFFALIPDTATEENKAPGVLTAPGYGWHKEALAGEEFADLDYYPPQSGDFHRYFFANAQALHYVKEGMVSIACEDLGYGEHGTDFRGPYILDDIGKMLYVHGRSLLGLTVEIRLAILQWLKTRPFVDRSKIAVSGHSLGVDSCEILCNLDDDVAAFVYNDLVCDMSKRLLYTSPPAHFYPLFFHMYYGIYSCSSNVDLLKAFAPKPLLVTEGGRTEELEKIKAAYKDFGAEDNFTYYYYRQYSDPKDRIYDSVPFHEGMTREEYFEYCNVVPEYHYFKWKEAVPWLNKALNWKQ